MTERKCGTCRRPGHTRATCPGTMEEQMPQSDRVAESGGIDISTPIHTGAEPGPWFEAQFPGICELGGEGFEQGEEIRADGDGGYECRECVPSAPLAPTTPTAGVFDLPAEAPVTVVEGPRTDRNGHRLKDPTTGDYRRYKNGSIRSIRRVTTFNKAVDSTDNLTGWMKRNVLIGASDHPEIVAEAHGLTHEKDKDQLNRLVKRLEEAAGSKKAADLGTLVHMLTERVDAGEPLSIVPAQFRPMVELYRETLAAAGLRVVPGLIENTTFIPEWGGVAGSFDRVFEHVATDARFIGDVKTGKSMAFGWQPIECQLAIYAKGYNRFGTYDWDRAEWSLPVRPVSEEHGIVVHLPVSGDLAGTCSLLDADLVAGWSYAAVCGAVWEQRGIKSKATPWTPPAGVERAWDVEFSSVTSRDQASALWSAAKASGVSDAELDRLVRLAQATLSMS